MVIPSGTKRPSKENGNDKKEKANYVRQTATVKNRPRGGGGTGNGGTKEIEKIAFHVTRADREEKNTEGKNESESSYSASCLMSREKGK